MLAFHDRPEYHFTARQPRPAMKRAILLLSIIPASVHAESIWLEAEHFDGIRGFCWPQGKPEMKKTDGHWGLSGPGWAAEWVQGGESGFLSIGCGADDDKAVASTVVDVPVKGKYRVWVRFRENRGITNRFLVRLTPKGGATV